MTTSKTIPVRSLLSVAASLIVAGPAFAGSGARSCSDPVNYCWTSPNSAGPGATLSWTGSSSPTADDFHLVASGCPPGEFLMFVYGAESADVPFGNGIRCVGEGGVGVFRIKPFLSTGAGTAVLKVDFSSPPTGVGGGAGRWLPGDTWYCQGWYRDPAGGGAEFNLTDGLEVTVCADGGPFEGMAPIPAGTFEMGRHAGSGQADEIPVHLVWLDAYYMDVFEVSNSKYADYLNAAFAEGRIEVVEGVVYQSGGPGRSLCRTNQKTAHSHVSWDSSTSTFGVIPGWEDQPMVTVSWFGACTYANALSRSFGLTPCHDETTWACDFGADGFRLPTEAEWECAARGGLHDPYYSFTWGWDIDGSKANYNNSGDPYEGGTPATTPVGYFDGDQVPAGVDMANGYGLYDMAGNVWEWCWDWWNNDYYENSPLRNPTGAPHGDFRVIRGGGWQHEWDQMKTANREWSTPVSHGVSFGFRVVLPRPE